MQDHLNRRRVRRTPRIGRRVLRLLLGIPFIALPQLCAADATISLLGSKVIDNRAMTLDATIAQYGADINGLAFQSPITTAAGYQFATYFMQSGTNRHVAVARRPIPTPGNAVPDWSVVELPNSKFTNGLSTMDAHNVVSIGVDPTDGTIHLAYDLHVNTLKYVRSNVGAATGSTWDASLFNPQQSNLVGTTTLTSQTYPLFFRTNDNGMQLVMRSGTSGNGSNVLYNYSNSSNSWTSSQQIDSPSGTYTDRFGLTKTARNAYPNGFTYSSDGRLHQTFTYREAGGVNGNHDILYVYSDDNGVTWKNNAGTTVTSGSTRFNVNTPGLVIRSIPAKSDMINTQGQNVDSENRIHVMMSHLDTAKSPLGTSNYEGTNASYYVYWRDELGNFHRNKIPAAVGTRPKIYFDADDNAIAIYNRADTLRIATATSSHNWTDWTELETVPGSSGFSSEALADEDLFKQNGILSVYMQKVPAANAAPSALHSLDYQIAFNEKTANTFSVASGDFNTAANWSEAAVPGQIHDAVIAAGRTATISNTIATAVGGDLALANSTGAGTLNVTDGSLSVEGSLLVGQASGAVGTYTQSGGTINVAKRFVVGDFTSTTSGGGLSTAAISGGTLNCDEIQIAMSANGSSSNSALTISGTAAVNVAGEVIIADAGNTGILNLNGGTLTVQGDMITGWNKTNTSRLNLNGGTLDMTGNSIQVTQLVLNSGRLSNLRAINGGQALTKNSAGVVSFAGTNTFANNWTLRNGSLRAESNNAFGTGQMRVEGGATNFGAAEFTGNITIASSFLMSGRQLAANDAPHLNNISGNNTVTGAITLTTGGNQYNFGSADGQLTIASNITGTSPVTGARFLKFLGAGNGLVSGNISNGAAEFTVVKLGAGTWTFIGTNTYTGGTSINEGTLAFTSGALGSTGSITFAGNSTLQWSGTNTQDISSRLVMTNGVTATLDTLGNNVILATGIGGDTSGSLTKEGTGTLILTGNNSYTGGTTIDSGILQVGTGGTVGSGDVTNNASFDIARAGLTTAAITGTGTTTINAAGATLTANSIRQAGLTIGAGNTVTVAANGTSSGVSRVTNLSINASGRLDLKDNDLIVDNGNLNALTALVGSGMNINGSFGSGPGIGSSTAGANPNLATTLGIATNSALGYSSFGGLAVDDNDVLIKYTYVGDSDLNGAVDTSTDFDLYITGLTSGGSLGGWLYGDFDYNGIVDSSTDFDLYITGLTGQGGSLLTAGSLSVTPVPEPGSLALIAAGVCGVGVLLRRRRAAGKGTR